MSYLESREYLRDSAAFVMQASISMEMEVSFEELAPLCIEAGMTQERSKVVSFSALSAVVESPFGIYIQGSLNALTANTSRCFLMMYRKPKTPAPSSMVESSESVGGYPHVLEKMRSWPVFQRPIMAMVKGMFFATEELKVPVRRRRAIKALKGLRFVEESIKFQVRSSDSELKEIVFEFEGKEVTINGTASALVQISENVFEEVTKSLWSQIERHLET
jgi:hypothetical protein